MTLRDIRCLHRPSWWRNEIREAVAAETERCALIADTYQDWCDNWGQDNNLETACIAATELAAAIRETPKEDLWPMSEADQKGNRR